MKTNQVAPVVSPSEKSLTFLEVVDAAGSLLLRTFNTAEATGFRQAWLSLGNECSVQRREISLPVT